MVYTLHTSRIAVAVFLFFILFTAAEAAPFSLYPKYTRTLVWFKVGYENATIAWGGGGGVSPGDNPDLDNSQVYLILDQESLFRNAPRDARVYFNLLNTTSSLQVTVLNTSTAMFILGISNIKVIMNVGQSLSFDINNNGKADLVIKLYSITPNGIDFSMINREFLKPDEEQTFNEWLEQNKVTVLVIILGLVIYLFLFRRKELVEPETPEEAAKRKQGRRKTVRV